MKLPLWVKDKNGKWHRFPYEALVTLSNGRLGVDMHNHRSSLAPFVVLSDEMGTNIWHFFDYSPNMDAYILKGQDRPGRKK